MPHKPGMLPNMGDVTPATRVQLSTLGRARTGGTRRRRRKKASRPRKTRRARGRARARKPARLVKGSAAAKRYMAKIRRKRR